MAEFKKRKKKNGKCSYTVSIRIKGRKPMHATFDRLEDGKIVFAQGAEGFLRVFDCVKVDTWSANNWRYGATIEFDGAEIKDVNGNMQKFIYNEKFKGTDITVGTSISSIKNTNTSGQANINLNTNTDFSPYSANTYGNANYSQNTSTIGTAFVNGHRITGENILIKKGRRFKILSAETFQLPVK